MKAMGSKKLEGTLNAAIEKHTFSGVVRIRHQGSIVYERAAGYADRNNKIANALGTRFGIASGTKFFTALAIGRLIEAGELSFSTRLNDCLSLDFVHYADEITIRHLLTHTSGIPDYYDEEKVTDFENFTVGVPWCEMKGPRDYLAVFPDEQMKFAPGEQFSYSNGGYILLGVIVEELSGMEYQDFVEDEVFAPAGMTRSGYFAMNRLPEKTAFGYVEDKEGWRTNIFDLPIIGASDGGAFTTLSDLDHLWDAFWGYEILSKETVEIYTAPHVQAKTEDPHEHYGHGIWIREEPGQNREEYVIGCDAGVSFKSTVDRTADTRITVISNTTDGAWPLLKEISGIVKE